MAQRQPGLQEAARVEPRVDDLLGRMTIEEKIGLVGGTGFETRPIARLGIPSLAMSDGPHGVRWEQGTCFPTSVCMAATWDPKLVEEVGRAIGREVLAKGRHVILGPCVNIHRVPHGGRNFESFSEDPYVAARMAAAYVRGVQAEGAVACPKHFACNNQEYERLTIDAKVDARALREIYLPAFEAAVCEAGALTVMAAYNRLNGAYACENKPLLTDILKGEWGFAGLVMSDWGAVHSTVPSANAGLDLEMPTAKYFGDALLEAVRKGEVSEEVIHDKVRRILRVMELAGLFEGGRKIDASTVDCPAHRALALKVAREGIVLLKNEGNVLPLNRDAIRSIAIVGPAAERAQLGGGGSSEVTPAHSISALEAIVKRAAGRIVVHHQVAMDLPGDVAAVDSAFLAPPGAREGVHGLQGEYFANREFQGEAAVVRTDAKIDFDWGDRAAAPGLPADHFSVRWTGKLTPPVSGDCVLATISDDGSRLFLDGELVIDNWGDHATTGVTKTLRLEAGRAYDLRYEFYEAGGAAVAKLGWTLPGDSGFGEAVRVAGEADVAIVFAGLGKRAESEGLDRTELTLPGRQNELIEAVAKANRRTVVVLQTGTPILMDRWLQEVPALVQAWYPGQEGGEAIADVLFGDVNPSGKLPVTFPRRWEDCPAYGNYPGKDGVVEYAEGIFVGYRHFDKKQIEPLFPFGFGLSYTQFEYSDLRVSPERVARDGIVRVTVTIKNIGAREGQEVVQLYVHDVEASVERPPAELKGFRKVALRPGASADATFELDRRALSFYDAKTGVWVAEPGRFEVRVGASSRDIRLRGEFVLE